ncbi:L-lysine 6-monooxygenase (NADPH-requiring)-domain-containing protein [Podospora appendiculata]|uniref:L-ornithine N(5)-monooxygenase [NAD(P)H] n=1 Tax=Podospora appendiculata TaxID=314037 RepID=A0AAE0XHG7_9PEZI|nr:L-lysine 6-monooxygenase (NADPH-requiring)-domain-containing protein [Podospora appendiculata]
MDESPSVDRSTDAFAQQDAAVNPNFVANGSAIDETNGVSGTSDAASETSAPELVDDFPTAAPGVKNEETGVSNSSVSKSRYLRPVEADAVHDLVCIGFGPASVAIAIALHDNMEAGKLAESPKVLFLEKQTEFAWHAGMLLPGAKMQISFVKDLASLRNPRSYFTFLNYLHVNRRLVEFTNLNTFLPARIEFEDYLRWCASHFSDVVRYGNEVVSVSPVEEGGPHKLFTVTSRNTETGITSTYQTRNVVVALGGQASIPKPLPAQNPRVIHSSQYAYLAPKILTDPSHPYRVAVIGAGQSAAEIFSNVQSLYPNSKTNLIMRTEFLKPSDDSPFVNSIFNPEFIERVYPMSSGYRQSLLSDVRATNYGVVRLELIEHLYEKMYHQRRTLGTDEKKWPHRLMPGRRIVNISENGDQLQMKVAVFPPSEVLQDGPLLDEELLDFDLVVCATGYKRTAHVDMLKDTWSLLPESTENAIKAAARKDQWLVETEEAAEESSKMSARILAVGRDYGVKFTPGSVAEGSGIWLQGCCEATHGLSDTLLSVLSTRSGEIVETIFGSEAGSR